MKPRPLWLPWEFTEISRRRTLAGQGGKRTRRSLPLVPDRRRPILTSCPEACRMAGRTQHAARANRPGHSQSLMFGSDACYDELLQVGGYPRCVGVSTAKGKSPSRSSNCKDGITSPADTVRPRHRSSAWRHRLNRLACSRLDGGPESLPDGLPRALVWHATSPNCSPHELRIDRRFWMGDLERHVMGQGMNMTRIAVVGDIIVDRYMIGRVHRISPEAPVPVLALDQERIVPGGAANVAANIAALGGTAVLVGLVGNDRAADALRSALERQSISPAHLVTDPGRPTSIKTRVVSGVQQIVRIDDESVAAPDETTEQALMAAIVAAVETASLLVLSDYAKGALSPAVLRCAIEAAGRAGCPVLVGPQATGLFGLSRCDAAHAQPEGTLRRHRPPHRHRCRGRDRRRLGGGPVRRRPPRHARRARHDADPPRRGAVSRSRRTAAGLRRVGRGRHGRRRPRGRARRRASRSRPPSSSAISRPACRWASSARRSSPTTN